MRVIIAIIIAIFYAGPVAAEETFVGNIYLAGTNRGVFLFQQKNSTIKKGNTLILRHTYTDAAGRTAVTEDVVYENGAFARYIVEFADGGCGCKLQREGSKVKFGFTRGDTRKTGMDDYSAALVMGPTLTNFVHGRWNRLLEGKTEYFYLPAMTLMRLARFQMYLNRESGYARKGVAVFRMDVSNYLFRLFVDPVELVYDLKSKRLVEIHGKSLLQRKVNGKVENPVVDIYYTY